jgi:hypothetical protein
VSAAAKTRVEPGKEAAQNPKYQATVPKLNPSTLSVLGLFFTSWTQHQVLGIFSFVFFAGEFHNVFAAALTHPLAGFIRLFNVAKDFFPFMGKPRFVAVLSHNLPK